MIYLDWAASAPMDDTLFEDFDRSWRHDFANPSAAHKAGKELAKKVESSRHFFLEALNASTEDYLVFTGSATESNNTLIKGLELKVGDKVVYFSADHPSLAKPIERVAKEKSLQLIEVSPLDEAWPLQIDTDVRLVLLTHVHGQNGLTLDLEKVATQIKEKAPGAHIHVDAVQSFGKISLDVGKMKLDSLSLSSHKISGPKGVGALYLKKGVEIMPLLDGGGHEGGMRSSTLAVPLIFAFEQAARNKLASLSDNFKHAAHLKQLIQEQLSEDVFSFPFQDENYSPFICCFLMQGVPSDIVMRHLEMDNIFVASSSACSSKIKAYNPTFEKLGIDKSFHKNVLRVSYGDKTSVEEIETFCEKLKETVKQLKGLRK